MKHNKERTLLMKLISPVKHKEFVLKKYLQDHILIQNSLIGRENPGRLLHLGGWSQARMKQVTLSMSRQP